MAFRDEPLLHIPSSPVGLVHEASLLLGGPVKQSDGDRPNTNVKVKVPISLLSVD